MRKHGEKWILEVEGVRHLVMAVGGRVKYSGSLCHGCSFVDNFDDDCTLKAPPCDMGCKIKDLGTVNEDGCLSDERTGLFPEISTIKTTKKYRWELRVVVRDMEGNDIYNICVYGPTRQEAIDRWNQREAL